MSYVDKGKQAEYIFAAAIIGKGMTPCWPSVESQPYDLICCTTTKSYRIQVKASEKHGPSIALSTYFKDKGKTQSYSKKEVDFIAVYLYSYDRWYIIPIDKAGKTGIYLKPENPKCKYKKYLEAWHLLDKSLKTK